MKITLKVLLITALVIAAGILFQKAMVIGMGIDDKTVASYTLQEEILAAKRGFVEKAEEIQSAAQILLDKSGLCVLSVRGGDPVVKKDTELVPLSQTLSAQDEASIKEVMSEYQAGCTVTNISVTDEGIIFYFGYYGDGVYGILYEKEPGSTKTYSTIELMENWKIFYRLPEL